MADSKTPLEHFLSWFATVPPDHQLDIATVASFLPGFESVQRVDDHSQIPNRFVDVVRSYMATESKLSEKAMSITLHYYVGPEIVEKRAASDWRAGQAGLGEVMDTLGYQEDDPQLQSGVNAAEFRHRQWIATRDKWRRLVAGPFSIEAIRRFAERQ
ncbi:hypothetical protein ACFQ3P_40105 [Paraburkholderia sabiae]|uniref:Uncharacterized protein n=1 Tax=Paraburkholderia sabiae TaxID=273251 RepID=A0ABU9QM01_9BURK|nr:hypothetical protein [Paraburkholderia sabiae]WJZ79985.1 hypothetical protein QEN71_43340 [Paraburkholderia sabiae]CAD6561192.1 hypothetical protein LMG24235_07214 [Paraburkholderia sabiae]